MRFESAFASRSSSNTSHKVSSQRIAAENVRNPWRSFRCPGQPDPRAAGYATFASGVLPRWTGWVPGTLVHKGFPAILQSTQQPRWARI